VSHLGKCKVDSLPIDQDSEFSYLESAFVTMIPKDLAGEDVSQKLTEMATFWRGLVWNTNILVQLTLLVYKFVKKGKGQIGLTDPKLQCPLHYT
jgi:hypothetical protein